MRAPPINYADAMAEREKRAGGQGLTDRQAAALGVSVTTYYKHKRDGLSHDAAIRAAQQSQARGHAHTRGNAHDSKCQEITNIMRKWQR